MKNDDILLLIDGRMLQILEKKSPTSDKMSIVQFIDNAWESHMVINPVEVRYNLGQSSETLAYFYSTRQIMLKLGQIKASMKL